MNYVEVAVPFFILAMALEFLYGRWVKKQTYRLNDTVNSLQLGVLSRLNDVLKLASPLSIVGVVIEQGLARGFSFSALKTRSRYP